MMVFAVIERERDDLIDGHDFRVAERGGKNLAELVQRGLDATVRGAAVVHDDRRGVNDGLIVVSPGALAAGNCRRAGDQARCCGGPVREHLKLHAAFTACLAMQ